MDDLKKDFPIFSNDDNLVYLDNWATVQKPNLVIDSVNNYLSNYNSNIHRWAYDIAWISETLYNQSKKITLENLWASEYDMAYTYNSTYAFNLLAQSFYLSWVLKKWDKILLWVAEHNANTVPWFMLREKWIEIDFIWLDSNFWYDINEFKQKYTDNVKVVSLNYVSNVTWIVYDLKKIKSLLREDSIFVVDGSQAVPNFFVDLDNLWCDFFVFTWHKMMALTWIAWLVWKKDIFQKLKSPIWWWWTVLSVNKESFISFSGAKSREAWTPNIVWAMSILKAWEYIDSIWWYDKIWEREQELNNYILKWFENLSDKVKLVWFSPNLKKTSVFSFVVDWYLPIDIWDILAEENVCVRSGAHCAHILINELWLKSGACRMSAYIYNDYNDIDKFFKLLKSL